MRKGEAVPEQTFWVYEMDMEELAVRKNIRDQRADERDEAAQLFTWCTVIALNQKEGIGASRLNRACNEMTEFQNRYRSKIYFGSSATATEAMREDLVGICDFGVRLPQLRAPKNRKEEQIQMARNNGAEIAWLVMASTVHLTFGFGKDRLARLKKESLDNYRQYIEWEKAEGEDVAMEWLKRCAEQALQEDLKVNDLRREQRPTVAQNAPPEVERYENLQVAGAVSRKMAQERGVRSLPIAVLSQDEIARRVRAL